MTFNRKFMAIVSRSQVRNAINRMLEARWNAQMHWSPEARSKVRMAETQCLKAEKRLRTALAEANRTCDSVLWKEFKEKESRVNDLLSRRY